MFLCQEDFHCTRLKFNLKLKLKFKFSLKNIISYMVPLQCILSLIKLKNYDYLSNIYMYYVVDLDIYLERIFACPGFFL